MNTIDHIQEIISLVKENGIGDTFFEAAREHVNAVTEVLHITPVQTAIFALLLEHFGDYSVAIDDLADTFKCKKIQMINYLDDFEELKHKKIIRETSNYRDHKKENRVEYTIPLDVINSVRKGIEFKVKSQNNLSPVDFFDNAEDLFTALSDDDIGKEILINEFKDLFDNNREIFFVKKLQEYNLDNDSMLIMLKLCCALVSRDEEKVDMDSFSDILGRNDFRIFQRGLKTQDHELQQKGFVEYTFNRGLFDTQHCQLTKKAKDEFLSDITFKEECKDKSLILSKKIIKKELFYNEKIRERINELSNLLRDDNFQDVKKRLSENGMRTGFACIFSGSPGTGKTETAFQIASSTGRDIMQVNISETKSCWFGESEKLVKGIFDKYRSLVNKSRIIPILLFNEADGVLGKRREISNISGGVDQTENAIQNIILQEMENLDGILIATTNMTTNLDKAFERRFLYKIEFGKPEFESKKMIWQSMMPSLKEEDVIKLAAQFDFSGGQIENIARKSTVHSVLKSRSPDISILEAFCKEESMEKTVFKIGFQA